MDLAHAKRRPHPGQNRRTHAPLTVEAALCGAKLGALAAADAEPARVTCLTCRAALHESGALPYLRRPSS